MAILNYQNGSLLSSVEVLVNAQGGTRAYLQASPTATPEAIAKMQQDFAKLGWIGIPCARAGKPYLELRGFKSPEELQRILVGRGMVQGTPEIMKSKEDEPNGFFDQIKASSLKYSGYTYVLGDSLFMAYATAELKDQYATLAHVRANLSKKTEVDLVKALHNARENVKGGWLKINSGVGYALGSLILAGYASRDQSHIEISNSIEKIEHYIKTEGMANVNGGAILRQEPEKKNLGLLEQANRLLRRYPSEALNVVYTGVGLSLMGSSFKQIGSMNQEIKAAQVALKKAIDAGQSAEVMKDLENGLKSLKQTVNTEIIDVGLGSITASSALAGIAIKEKKSMEGEHKREGLAGVWDWIQEKPLRATGYGFLVATGFHAWATAKKWLPTTEEKQALQGVGELKLFSELPSTTSIEKDTLLKNLQKRRRFILGRAGFVVATVLAELMMIISSKGHGDGVRNEDVDESVIASTAEYVAKQDPATQGVMIERLAGYMSNSDVLGMKAETIANELREQVASIGANPWAQSNPYVDASPTAPSPTEAVVAVAELAKPTQTPTPVASRIQAATIARQGMVEAGAQHAMGAKV